jgi:hypothetical protein
LLGFNAESRNSFHEAEAEFPGEPSSRAGVSSAVSKTERIHTMNSNDKKPDPWTSNMNEGSNSTTIAIIVVALVLVVGAFIFFGSSTTTAPDGQQLTQNNMPPAPITEPATPLPATPPANEPATAPATPPADAPAADP